MKKRDELIWEKIALRLSNEELSESDNDIFVEWQGEDENNKKLFQTLNSVHLQSDDDAMKHKDEILNLTYSKMFSLSLTDSKSKKKGWLFTVSIAASLLLLLGLGGYVYLNNANQERLISYSCPAGQYSKKIVLPDNSEVILNSGSKLTYDEKNFSHKNRKVHLDGEAMFDVTHDEDCPFIVGVSCGQVKVLGTQFNVRSYKNEDQMQATLVRGSVEVTSKLTNEVIRIRPNEQATIVKSEGRLSVSQVNIDDYILWKDGWLQFQALPFKDIVFLLERNYNVKIDIENNNSNNQLFTGRFRRSENIEDVISVIQVYCKYQFKKVNNQYVIY